MKEEDAYELFPFGIQLQQDMLRLSLEFDLSKILPQDSRIHMAVSAIIKDTDGKASYWALTHSGLKADFHRRDSFIIEL